ncbi:uncharacterized protein [Diadema antillarum]|uniref:uncharacterized protein n=1 Tax=Diadema antillarum TaxID=105358 RepID=UPI003A8BE30C
MASRSHVCRWLLITIIAFLSVIPTATAQTGTMSSVVTMTPGTTSPDTSIFTSPSTITGMTTETPTIATSSSSETAETTAPTEPPYTGTGTPPGDEGTQTTATSYNGAMTTEPEDISPGSSSSQLTTLEMVTEDAGNNSTSGDVGSTATREKMRTEGVSTTSGECEGCTDEPEEPGLSPGEIAGIVIGSVAGVAIIGGGIGYAIHHVKTPTKVTPTTDIEIQDMSDSPEANSDQAKLTNASDTHRDGDD